MAETDLFDFSDVKIITGSEGDKIPAAIEEKPKELKPLKKESTAIEKQTKAVHEEKNFQLGEIFKGTGSQAPQSLNAKKLDIDFDTDDFFN